jgi:hypothetical protein
MQKMIEELSKAIEAGPMINVESTIKIEPIDTSGWSDLEPWFLEAPLVNKYILTTIEAIPNSSIGQRMATCVSFLSVSSTDANKATDKLYRELVKIQDNGIFTKAFLAKPSLLSGVRPLKNDEKPDTTIIIDLSGPKPGKKLWIAASFVFLYKFVNGVYTPIWKEELDKITDIAVLEGQAGPEI